MPGRQQDRPISQNSRSTTNYLIGFLQTPEYPWEQLNENENRCRDPMTGCKELDR